MRIETPRRREAGESVVPMINVVFLLLIFFLMTAQVTPPAPFEVTPPQTEEGAPPEGRLALHVSAEGEIGFGESRGDEAIAALSARTAEDGPLPLRADAKLEAAALAGLLKRLSEAGVPEVEIVATAP